MAIMTNGLGDDRPVPTYRQIQIIEAIARHRAIGQAAAALHLSQPAVTRTLQTVEDMLGVRLFDRTPNGVVPTVFVEPILRRAPSLELKMRETDRELENLRKPQNRQLQIGAGIHSIEIWGNRALASLVLSDPDLQISIHQYDWNDIISKLIDGSIDYGIGEISALQSREDVVVEPLANMELYFVCGAHHPLVSINNPDIDDVIQFPMVGNKMTAYIARNFKRKPGRLGAIDHETGGISSAIRVSSASAIKHILIGSDAIAIMPLETVRNEIEAGSLVALGRRAMPWLTGRIGFIAARSRKVTPLIRTFRDAVLTIEKQRQKGQMANLSLVLHP